MKRYPLLFSYRETVAGKGFLAHVQLDGRALFEVEEGETWLSGVNPGGLAGEGQTPPQAYLDFRRRLTGVLYDLAEETPDLTAFRDRVERFFWQSDEDSRDEWERAREEVRTSDDDLGGLPKNADPPEPWVQVEELVPERATPAQNTLERQAQVAA